MPLMPGLTPEERIFMNHQGGGAIWRVRPAADWPVAVGLVQQALVEVDRPITGPAPEHSFEARCIVYERTERAQVYVVMRAMAQAMERRAPGEPTYDNSVYRRVCNILEAIDAQDPNGPIFAGLDA